MIGTDPEAAETLRRDLAACFDTGGLDEDIGAKAHALLDTVTDPRFPGLLCPSCDGENEMRVFAAVETPAQWQRLAPLLTAFAGPTLTDFSGTPSPLPAGNAVAARVAGARPGLTGVLALPSGAGRKEALVALDRLRHMLATAPTLEREHQRPTAWLLDRFDDALGTGDRSRAQDILDRVRRELRLDAVNLAALQTCLEAAFGRWSAIFESEGFSDLVRARKTPAMALLLLEAIYRGKIDPDGKRDADALKTAYDPDLAALTVHLLPHPLPPGVSACVARLAALETLRCGNPVRDLAAHLDRLGPLSPLVERLLEPEPETIPEPVPQPSAELRQATSVPAASDPDSWLEWLSLATDPDFGQALSHARAGAEAWPIGDAQGDPVSVAQHVEALEKAWWAEGTTQDRCAAALPLLVRWLTRDPAFPRATMQPLYDTLLTLFALFQRRDAEVYDSARVMVGALLELGLDDAEYRAIIEVAEELVGESPGLGGVFRVLDTVEEFLLHPAPNQTARTTFLQTLLSRIAPLYPRMSAIERHAVSLLAGELDWTLPPLPDAAPPDTSTTSLADALEGKRIAIYSLTEDASREAAVALRDLAPGVTVECNADHGGTEALRALADGADIFVMVWRSAKHAATDFIRKHRGKRPLSFAAGRGMSSILRAVEQHVAEGR